MIFPPADYIDAAWWEVYSAPLRAERMTLEAWVNALALAYRIVRIPESLTARQLEIQQDMVDCCLGRKFLTTEPLWPGGLRMVKTIYPTLAGVLARIEALKRVGVWPAYYLVQGGWALSYDPPAFLLELDSHGYLTLGAGG